MPNPRIPFFLPEWAACLFDRVAAQSGDDKWYGRMMATLVECDDWSGFYHRQAGSLIDELVLPRAGQAADLVGRTGMLHHADDATPDDWTSLYQTLFRSACVKASPQYDDVERLAIKASLHACLESPLRGRPIDPLWSVVFAVNAVGDDVSAWRRTSRFMLDAAEANVA